MEKKNLISLQEEPVELSDPEIGHGSILIEPQSTFTIVFKDLDHFEWGISTIKKGKLYIKLSIVGRKKPLCILVYDPSKR